MNNCGGNLSKSPSGRKWRKTAGIILIITGLIGLLCVIAYGLKKASGISYVTGYPKPSKEKQNLSAFNYILTDSRGYVYCFQDGSAVNIYDSEGDFLRSFYLKGHTADSGAADMINDYICAAIYRRGGENDYEVFQYKYGEFHCKIAWEKDHIIQVSDKDGQKCFELNMDSTAINDYEIMAYLDEKDVKGVLCRKNDKYVIVSTDSEKEVSIDQDIFEKDENYHSSDSNGNRYEIVNTNWPRGQKLVRTGKDGKTKVMDVVKFWDNSNFAAVSTFMFSLLFIQGGKILHNSAKK